MEVCSSCGSDSGKCSEPHAKDLSTVPNVKLFVPNHAITMIGFYPFLKTYADKVVPNFYQNGCILINSDFQP